jgi:hypothetical protein
VVWEVLMGVIGIRFVVWGRAQSEFVIYRLLAARSRIVWVDRVHGFVRRRS